MKFFSKQTPAEEDDVPSRSSRKERDLLDQIDELKKNTEEVEAEKAAKKLAREERAFHKSVEQKRKQQERWIAPALLLLTLLISYLIALFSR